MKTIERLGMNKTRQQIGYGKWVKIISVFGLVVFFLVIFLIFDFKNHPSYAVPLYNSGKQIVVNSSQEKNNHLKTPEAVKAIYMTSCVAGTPTLRQRLVDLVLETELNAIIIDIKDYTGAMSYPPTDQSLMPLWEATKCGAKDMEDFIAFLHEKNIYVIGRITVFQDPLLAKRQPEVAVKFASSGEVWRDRKGLNFTDPGSKIVWDYHVALANDAYQLGFDELNFDYIRYPSDGPMGDIYFPFSKSKSKQETLESFFAYLHQKLSPTGVVLSADLFGMTTTNTDDLNIGQVLERALPYFDYIAPMVYPSHYPNKFNGWPDPNAVPYELIKYVMTEGVKRTVATSTTIALTGAESIASTTPQLYKKTPYSKNKLRPWLQDFDYPVSYDAADVRAQIKATYDAGLNSWMLWDPANRYTREALENN